VRIAVASPAGAFEATPSLYWSEFNQGYMKTPHIQRYLTHDVYISPLEVVGQDTGAGGELWLIPGETKRVGSTAYTFEGFDPQMGEVVRLAARMRVEMNGRTVPARPVLEINTTTGSRSSVPAYLPGGGSIEIVNADPNSGRVALVVPGMAQAGASSAVLAVEVSTKPFIGLVWFGALLMLLSAYVVVFRRTRDLDVVLGAGEVASAG